MRGLREHRTFLGLELAAEVGEVVGPWRPELGVHVAHCGEERVAHPTPVHGIVGTHAALEFPGEAAAAHGVGPLQHRRCDLRQRRDLDHAARLRQANRVAAITAFAPWVQCGEGFRHARAPPFLH